MIEKRWELINEQRVESREQLVEILLENRGIKDPEDFFNPPSPNELINQLDNFFPDLDKGQLDQAVSRIQAAIENKEKIIVWGDYDVDGVCAAAVLWQTIYGLGANALPHIPDRFQEGYGLNAAGIKKLSAEGCRLIVTVDSGITAVEEAELARELGMDLIITDHHLKPEKLPAAAAIVHTTALCGTGIAWLLASHLSKQPENQITKQLDLVAIATIADLQPLLGANRALVKAGFEVLNRRERPGLAALAEVAGFKGELDSFAAGWVLGPRINAIGRIKHGIEALRLLCTSNRTQAFQLAQVLNQANTERQAMTVHTFDHAKGLVEEGDGLIVVYHDSWHEGIIGLVAGRIAEEYGRPAIVVSQGKDFSKGSARSVNGLNIVDVLRAEEDLLEDVGGHAAAAGFTIRTENLEKFVKRVRQNAAPLLEKLDPQPLLKIDARLSLDRVDQKLVNELRKFAPHGVGNPDSLFLAEGVEVQQVRKVGRGKNHLKLGVAPSFEVLWFNASQSLERGQKIDFAYTPQLDRWNGREGIVLKARDMKLSC
ncbi:MAG: single-stranded-DNA-specific exonuclease RecJ [Patescibacteria group bacterium]